MPDTIDLSRLIRNLCGVKAEEDHCEELNQYLYDEVFRPLLSGEPLRVGALDYEAFTLDDITELYRYWEDVQGGISSMEYLVKTLCHATPTSTAAPVFC